MKHRLTIILAITAAGAASAGFTQARQSAPSAEAAVIQVERDRLKAFGGNDKPAFERLVRDDLVMTHSNGEVLGKAEEMAAMRSSTPDDPLPRLGIEDVKVRLYGKAAVITGALIETSHGRTVLGLRFTNTYVRDKSGWRLAAGQLTKVSGH